VNKKPATIDEYLCTVPADQRIALEKLRSAIKAAAPEAVEGIGYGMPAFKYQGRPLAYFAGSRNHCAIYGPAVDEFRGDLAGYKTSKGTIRFTPDKPLPDALVRKLIKARITGIKAAEADRARKKVRARSST
jgi:uncharacterized protein YdhG (YjbR/CyaY superfamily)